MNYRWHSHKHCYTYASEFTCMLIKSKRGKVERRKRKQKLRDEHKKNDYLLLLAETMEERRRVHRCHSQHKPLSLTYMNLNLT